MLRPLLALLVSLAPILAAEKFFEFGEYKIGECPPGFRSAVNGSGQPGDWKVILDDAPSAMPPLTPGVPSMTKRAVLAQLSRDKTDEHSPLLIFEGETFGDFTVSTRFKLVEGEVEQMAGLAFRIQDEKNYYYIRASALGGTFYFFKIVDGIRSAPIGSKVAIPKGIWQEMTIECKGNQIRAWLNGKEAFPTLGDKSFASGKLGFWTKSDSVSYFADTKVVYTPKEILAQVLVRDAFKKYPRLQGVKIFAAMPAQPELRLIASNDRAEIGSPAQKEMQDVLARSTVYHGKDKDKGTVTVVMPLHDCNGETVAAVKVVMKAFPGQTEKNAIARALPIVKQMEARIQSAQDLLQ